MHIHSAAKAALAAVALTALPLAACQADLEEPELDAAGTTTLATPTETETVTEEVVEYVEVDPARFKEGTGYVVGGGSSDGKSESGVSVCVINPGDDYPANCQTKFQDPVPPAEEFYGVPPNFDPNVVAYYKEEQRFRAEHSPGAQGYATPPTPLKKGERTTIDGFILTHLKDGGFRVEYKGAWFELHGGIYEASPAAKPAENSDKNLTSNAAATETAPGGTVCGEITGPMGQDLYVIATKYDTTCGPAMEAMNGYMDALNDGQTEGQAAFWTAPNGWGCTARWFFPDEEYVGANGKMSCGAASPSGEPAKEGSGEVVALTEEDRKKVS